MFFNNLARLSDFVDGFLKYNLTSKFKVLKPRSLIINITYNCNSRCVMCNIWKMKPVGELTASSWKPFLKDPIFKNIKDLTISGGEAFLVKDYFETVKLFIDSMPKLKRLVLNTNGFLVDKIITDVKQVYGYCRLKKINLSVSVSIDGIGKDHDDIRNIKHAFDLATKTVKKLSVLNKNNNFNVGVSSVLLNTNIDKYNQIRQWFKKNKINHNFQLVGFHDTYVNNLNQKNELDFKDKDKILNILDDLRKEDKFLDFNSYYWNDMYQMYKSDKRRTTPCPFLNDGFSIDSLGDVYYCLSVKPIGNFIKDKKTISQIYFDPKNINFRKSLWKNECRYCNSGCETKKTIAYDFKKYLWFKISGKN